VSSRKHVHNQNTPLSFVCREYSHNQNYAQFSRSRVVLSTEDNSRMALSWICWGHFYCFDLRRSTVLY